MALEAEPPPFFDILTCSMGPTCFSLVFNVCESSFHCFHSTEECKNHGRSPCSDAKSIISTGCCPQLLYKPCSNYSSISYIFQTIQDLSCVMDDIYIYIHISTHNTPLFLELSSPTGAPPSPPVPRIAWCCWMRRRSSSRCRRTHWGTRSREAQRPVVEA